MKLFDAVSRVDALKQNCYTQKDKIEWLSRLDHMVKTQIIDTHEGGEKVTFTGYDDSTDPHTELLIPAPFDEAYLRWMEAQIDYHNGEYAKYNNSIQMFHTAYDAYRSHYNRNHMPIGHGIKFF